MAKAKQGDAAGAGDAAMQALEKEIQEAIKITKKEVEIALKEDARVDKLKIVTYWDIGSRLNNLTKTMNPKEKKAMLDRFSSETEMSRSFYYLATKFNSVFTDDQYKKAVANGMTVRVMKALCDNKKISDERRAALIHQAVTAGLKPDDIREINGTKNARRDAAKPQRAAAAKKQPPRRIFTTALDRVLLLEESVGFATDAVGRMAKLSDKDVADATKALVNLRTKAQDLSNVLGNFIKFTSNVSKLKGDGK